MACSRGGILTALKQRLVRGWCHTGQESAARIWQNYYSIVVLYVYVFVLVSTLMLLLELELEEPSEAMIVEYSTKSSCPEQY